MKVAVVGSGVMGLGITQAFAQSEGYEVNLCVVSGKGFYEYNELGRIIPGSALSTIG